MFLYRDVNRNGLLNKLSEILLIKVVEAPAEKINMMLTPEVCERLKPEDMIINYLESLIGDTNTCIVSLPCFIPKVYTWLKKKGHLIYYIGVPNRTILTQFSKEATYMPIHDMISAWSRLGFDKDDDIIKANAKMIARRLLINILKYWDNPYGCSNLFARRVIKEYQDSYSGLKGDGMKHYSETDNYIFNNLTNELSSLFKDAFVLDDIVPTSLVEPTSDKTVVTVNKLSPSYTRFAEEAVDIYMNFDSVQKFLDASNNTLNKEEIREEMLKAGCKYYIDDHNRCVALKNFANVKIGARGGIVSSYTNLSQKGDCWVYPGSAVYDNAQITGDVRIVASVIEGSCEISDDVVILHSKIKDIDVCGDSLIAESSIDGSRRAKKMVFRNVILHNKKNLILSGYEDVDERA